MTPREVTRMNNMIGPRDPEKREAPRNASKTAKRLLSFLSDCRGRIILMLVLLAASTGLNLTIPDLTGRAVDTLDLSQGNPAVDWSRLILLLMILLAVFVVSSLLSWLQGRIAAKLTRSVTLSIRKKVSDRLIRLPVSFFDTHRGGDMLARLTNDVDNIANLISQALGTILSAAIVIVGCVVIMLVKNPLLTAVCLSTVVLNILCTVILSKKMLGYFRRQQQAVGAMNSHVEQSIAAKKTIDSYRITDDAVKENEKLSDELTQTSIKAQVLGGAMPPLMCIIGNINFLLIVVVGALLFMNGGYGVTIGMIQAFTLYSRQFTKPINELSGIISQLMTALSSAERVFEIIDAPVEEDNGKTMPESGLPCSIRFEHVSFSYVRGVKVLDDFNLEIAAGEKIALVGRTGVGKTTLISLLMRFYELDEGRILINDVDIRDIPKAQLRSMVTTVLQSTSLIDGSVRENIAYGRFSADKKEIENAARATFCDEFIGQLEEGMDTPLSANDTQLSQGQRQLLCLARASLTSPGVLVLDEATSSVDAATEEMIREAMFSMMQGRTCIVIAHRLSTIKNMDRIAVFQDGKIAENGSHTELLKNRGAYYHLYHHQYDESVDNQ